MQFHVDWTVEHAALEVARVAHEGIGSTKFEELKSHFNQQVQQYGDDREVQLRAVTRLMVKSTDMRTGPKDITNIRIAALCLMWLASTCMRDWTVLQLYNWILPQMQEEQ